jgi:hypothetical protein
MLALVEAVIGALVAAFRPRASLVAENLALRQQLATLTRDGARHRLGPIDRAFWVVLSRIWSRWADVLAIAKPATVINWHRRRFARFWAHKASAASYRGGVQTLRGSMRGRSSKNAWRRSSAARRILLGKAEDPWRSSGSSIAADAIDVRCFGPIASSLGEGCRSRVRRKR